MKKKLFLNKQTITRLNNTQQQSIKGGESNTLETCDCNTLVQCTTDRDNWCNSIPPCDTDEGCWTDSAAPTKPCEGHYTMIECTVP